MKTNDTMNNNNNNNNKVDNNIKAYIYIFFLNIKCII